MRSSLYTRLHDTMFWNTLGIFLSATRFPSLGSVTDLKTEDNNINLHRRKHCSKTRVQII